MRALLGLATIAVIAWSGWWYFGANTQETALRAWLDERANAGWLSEYEDISVAGYPNRIDSTVSGLMLADPASGWAWSAELFQILMLSYKPNHIIAVWPGVQKISSPYDTVEVTSDVLRGSLVFAPDTALTLDRSRVELSNLRALGSGWNAALETGNFATERLGDGEGPENSHAIGLDAKNLSVPELAAWASRGSGILPDVMDYLRVDIIAAFDAPWDRFAIEGRKPQLTVLNLRNVEAQWGELKLSANGRLDVDTQGYPVGDLQVSATNWRDMLKVAAEAGLIQRDMASTIESGLNLLAMLSGNGEDLSVPLSFSDGFTRLGPIPIGPAPKLTTG